MIKVAFWFDAPVAYSGGLNYVANLLYALSTVNKSEVHPYIFFGTDVPYDVIQRFRPLATVVRTNVLKRKTFTWLVHKLLYKLVGSMAVVNLLMNKHGIDLVSHTWTPYLGTRKVKVISWIPDFQYLHLPEMFPNLNVERTNDYNRRIVNHSDAVIVSSQHALDDLRTLVPQRDSPPVEILRFVSQSLQGAERGLPELKEVQTKINFSGEYFLVPNQFWAHKNHEVILNAVVKAKRDGLRMAVLMTGNEKDYRLSGSPYIDKIKGIIEAEGIGSEVRILGVLEYKELLVLMRHCIAIINPSRFEGWSSTVEEAKSLGKPIILSNIPVHREQAPRFGSYFECDDSESLKDIMSVMWAKSGPAASNVKPEAIEEELEERTARFGKCYIDIIKKVALAQ